LQSALEELTVRDASHLYGNVVFSASGEIREARHWENDQNRSSGISQVFERHNDRHEAPEKNTLKGNNQDFDGVLPKSLKRLRLFEGGKNELAIVQDLVSSRVSKFPEFKLCGLSSLDEST